MEMQKDRKGWAPPRSLEEALDRAATLLQESHEESEKIRRENAREWNALHGEAKTG